MARRRQVLHDVLAIATEPEQALIRSILGGELRQGALDGVMTAAVAKAAGIPVAEVRRAAMFAGSLPEAARVALTDGSPGLAGIVLTPSRPVQPMLASAASDVADALAATGPASVELKLDGARIQAHRASGEVRLFTRNLNDVTERLGGVVEVVQSLPGGDLVLDGEVLGIDESGSPRRFQDTIGDFGAEGRPRGGRGSGLQAFFFDVLHVGVSVVDEPLSVRREMLATVVPASSRLPSIVTADPVEAQRFLDRAIGAGHEGVMVKDLEATYDAGRRRRGVAQGQAGLHLRPRRAGGRVGPRPAPRLAVEPAPRRPWPGHGDFVMVGKTFKGLTDEMLRWQTERFLR